MPGLPWIITVRGSMIMLAMFFKRNLNAISKIGGIGSISSISGISSNSESKTGIKVREDYQYGANLKLREKIQCNKLK